MKNLNFTVPNTRQEATLTNTMQENNLIGLDAFMSTRLDIKNSTETPVHFTNNAGQPVRSNCSDYCATSTCWACC